MATAYALLACRSLRRLHVLCSGGPYVCRAERGMRKACCWPPSAMPCCIWYSSACNIQPQPWISHAPRCVFHEHRMMVALFLRPLLLPSNRYFQACAWLAPQQPCPDSPSFSLAVCKCASALGGFVVISMGRDILTSTIAAGTVGFQVNGGGMWVSPCRYQSAPRTH